MDAYISTTARTPRGKGREGGALSALRPIDLVATLLRALPERGDAFDPALVDDLLLGCVTQTREQGADLARIAALYADWPDAVSGATLNRFCASGLDALQLAAAKVHSGMERAVVAGGVESMSRVPIYADKGPWFADPDVARKTGFVQMGFAADLIATQEGITRDELDAYASRSHQRAATAHDEGRFTSMLPITQGDATLDRDELVRPGTTPEKLARFAPIFGDEASSAIAIAKYEDLKEINNLHHIGCSPGLADGAALALVTSRKGADALGVRPRARVLAYANTSVEPIRMLDACIGASELAMQRANLTAADLDVVEVNEAFAATAIATRRALGIDAERYNPNGGVLAMGHAMGATGAILVMTALDELERRDADLALVAISGGAGLGSAMILERC